MFALKVKSTLVFLEVLAYKSPFLVRLLIKNGADVKVVLTQRIDFVTLQHFQRYLRISQFIFYEIKDKEDNAEWNNHGIGFMADFMVIAPATSNTISSICKM